MFDPNISQAIENIKGFWYATFGEQLRSSDKSRRHPALGREPGLRGRDYPASGRSNPLICISNLPQIADT